MACGAVGWTPPSTSAQNQTNGTALPGREGRNTASPQLSVHVVGASPSRAGKDDVVWPHSFEQFLPKSVFAAVMWEQQNVGAEVGLRAKKACEPGFFEIAEEEKRRLAAGDPDRQGNVIGLASQGKRFVGLWEEHVECEHRFGGHAEACAT